MRSLLEFDHFVQEVPIDGCEWQDLTPAGIQDSREPQRVLVPKAGSPLKKYQPLVQDGGLFRHFVDLHLDENSVCAFSSKYGQLGIGKSMSRDGYAVSGESIFAWTNEQCKLRRAVMLHDLVKAGNRDELMHYIKWNTFQVYAEFDTEFQSIAGGQNHPQLWKGFQNGDVIAPAKVYLQSFVNEQLHRLSVGAKMLWRSDNMDRLELRVVPTSLIGCMWLQFASELEGAEYKRCPRCGRWFEIGEPPSPNSKRRIRASRRDKKFCSDTCRANFIRKKESV